MLAPPVWPGTISALPSSLIRMPSARRVRDLSLSGIYAACIIRDGCHHPTTEGVNNGCLVQTDTLEPGWDVLKVLLHCAPCTARSQTSLPWCNLPAAHTSLQGSLTRVRTRDHQRWTPTLYQLSRHDNIEKFCWTYPIFVYPPWAVPFCKIRFVLFYARIKK